MTEETDTSIEELAARWLATERQASDRGNAGGTEERARAASAAYERAVTSASPEELLIAWHAALNVQYACEIGSASWAEARADLPSCCASSILARGGDHRLGRPPSAVRSMAG